MRGLFGSLRRGWRNLRTAAAPPVPFEVSCGCGRLQRGLRSTQAQVLRCDGCGEPVFVLPRSPLSVLPAQDGAQSTGSRRRSPWLLPLAAAAVTLVVVVVVFILVFTTWLRPGSSGPSGGGEREEAAVPDAAESMVEGRKLLRDRSFRQALKVLQAAHDRDRRNRELKQLYRQARLLAEQMDVSLETVIENLRDLPEKERPEKFKDYAGKSVLFDDVIRRDHRGVHHLTGYEVKVGGEKARVDLDLKLLRALPLEQPRRLLFGARLESVARGDGGLWIVRFDPDSGVLLTDEGAARACGLPPLDAELRALLRQQAAWVRQLP
jgi:hypothetical protein